MLHVFGFSFNITARELKTSYIYEHTNVPFVKEYVSTSALTAVKMCRILDVVLGYSPMHLAHWSSGFWMSLRRGVVTYSFNGVPCHHSPVGVQL